MHASNSELSKNRNGYPSTQYEGSPYVSSYGILQFPKSPDASYVSATKYNSGRELLLGRRGCLYGDRSFIIEQTGPGHTVWRSLSKGALTTHP
jgi:hypothetical protein